VGTLFYGLLSDKIGRVPALILSNFCGFAGDFSTIFTKSVATFTLCRFISGLAADTNFYLMYIIGKQNRKYEMVQFIRQIDYFYLLVNAGSFVIFALKVRMSSEYLNDNICYYYL